MQKYLTPALHKANMTCLHYLYASNIYLESATYSIPDPDLNGDECNQQWKLLLLVKCCVLTCGLVMLFV